MDSRLADSDEPALARIEFSPDEEAGLSRLAWALGMVGAIQIGIAGIGLVMALVLFSKVALAGAIGGFLMVALLIAIIAVPLYQGLLLREAGESIGRVANTDDADQDHLMAAFRRFRVIFAIEAIWMMLVVVREVL